ncbi:MAG TPA: hypothetical protein VND97_01515 [Beijerinckiaceae bacterium]|nr:hypothetical protein [Beijerinckiaceae bacterium]
MSFSEFSSLLGVFLSGAPTAEVSLTLTQAPENAALLAFIEEALRAGDESRMRLREVQIPDGEIGDASGLVPGVEITHSGDPSVVRFVYAPQASV